MELVKRVTRWGNSGGVLLPREWMGTRVKITVIEQSPDIQKEVFILLQPYLNDIVGVYLAGSYARGEQDENSDIDIIAISKHIKKEIASGRYTVSIIPLEQIQKTLKRNPMLLMPRLKEARALVNKPLLEELQAIPYNKNSFKEFIASTKRIILINKEIIARDERSHTYVHSIGVIYSLMLRLRGVFIMQRLRSDKSYSTKEFLRWVASCLLGENIKELYAVYRNIRDNRPVKAKVQLSTAQKLVSLLEREVL